MKFILLISIVLFNANLVLSQPISTSGIKIEKTLIKDKIVCLGSEDGINYHLSIKRKCKNCIKKSFSIRVNKYSYLIYKKDTMRLKLLFDSYSPFRFQIDSLLFQKGNFNIDLKGCKEILKSDSFPISINKLPNDCMPYLKEEKEP